MRKLIVLLSATMLVTPAFAGGTVALNDAEPEAIQQMDESQWAIEVELTRSSLSTQSNFGSLATYDTVCSSGSQECTEQTSLTTASFAVFRNVGSNYSIGLRYQQLDALYDLHSSGGENLEQDVSLLTLAARRHLQDLGSFSPFVELGIARYKSDSTYFRDNGSLTLSGSRSGWTPVVGAGGMFELSNRTALVTSLRYINSVGNKSAAIDTGNVIQTLDEPVTQLSIGLRFEL